MFTTLGTARRELHEILLKRGITAIALVVVFVAGAPKAFSQG